MDDEKIVALFWARDERAIAQTQQKYGRYCYTVARRIVSSHEDAEECVNDTYLRAWDAMPPHRPTRLSAFLGKITRNLAIDRYLYRRADKRDEGVEMALDELGECLSEDDRTLSPAEELALRDAVNGFLATLPARTRCVFLRRYWQLLPIADIARESGMSEGALKVLLHRTRLKFKQSLQKEGFSL